MSETALQDLYAVFGLSVRVLIAAVFAQGLAHKLRESARFRAELQRFDTLPTRLVQPVSLALAGCEIAALLTLAVTPVIGLPLASALLVVYAVAMALNVWRGRRDIDCGCGGVPMPISWGLVARNFFLAGLALLAVNAAGLSTLSVLMGLLAGSVCVLLYWTLHELAPRQHLGAS